jgi:hypothetical protein
MSSESIVYGFIDGATYEPPAYRRLQENNFAVLAQLPDEDDFPCLTREMFAAPPPQARRGTSRSQVIHFGASMNGLEFGVVPLWVEKFEALLRRLYWIEATAHVWTDFIDGAYQFWWHVDDSIMYSYRAGRPRPSDVWVRKELHFTRSLDGPPTTLWASH